ncbi:MAG: hypothetical protein M1812_007269 [Candelaria pacifica]|nr:MAG: hypothetical protein M1812_007269 [Candelaria pacifica]
MSLEDTQSSLLDSPVFATLACPPITTTSTAYRPEASLLVVQETSHQEENPERIDLQTKAPADEVPSTATSYYSPIYQHLRLPTIRIPPELILKLSRLSNITFERASPPINSGDGKSSPPKYHPPFTYKRFYIPQEREESDEVY